MKAFNDVSGMPTRWMAARLGLLCSGAYTTTAGITTYLGNYLRYANRSFCGFAPRCARLPRYPTELLFYGMFGHASTERTPIWLIKPTEYLPLLSRRDGKEMEILHGRLQTWLARY